MATNISHLAVILSANASGFSSGLSGAGGSLTGFMGTMGGLGTAAGSLLGPLAAVAAGIGVVAIASKAAGTALDLLKRGIGLAADYEQASVAFESMLGSAD